MSRIDVCRCVSRVDVSKVSRQLEVLNPGDDSLKRTGSRKTSICESQEFTNKQQPINLQNGKLQVLGSTENSIIHSAESTSRIDIRRSVCRDDVSKQPINLPNGKLQVFGPTENLFIHSAESTSRPGSSAGRQGSSERRCYTPTKQISLCTVKRIAPSRNIPEYNAADFKDSKKIDTDPMQKKPNTAEKESTELHSASIHKPNITEQPESSSDEDESDNEKPGAPIQLLAEFIKAVMDEDYKLAWKLCQMILIYEPENPEAKEFSPLIQKMLQNEEDHDSDEEDSEDTDEGDDSSDSDSNSTESSEASSEDEPGN